MSRKLLAFLLSELSLVRVICKKCESVVELPITKMVESFTNAACPLCRQRYTHVGDPDNPFVHLATAVREFRKHDGVVDIEFVLDDNSPAPKPPAVGRG